MGLSQLIAKKLTDYENPNSLGSRLRRARIQKLLKLIDLIYAQKGSVSILDVGGTKKYWNILPPNYLADRNIHITLVNLFYDYETVNEKYFTYEIGDACQLTTIKDFAFDIVHSNSVIEHVGDWSRMQLYAREVRRVAKYHFIQTPNFWFPFEPHSMTFFFHWLPKPWRVSLVRNFNLGHHQRQPQTIDAVATVEGTRLLDRSMMVALFPDSTIASEKIVFMTKSLIAVNG